MSAEQRQALIRSMVERLAARMQAEPVNLDGWMKLGNAYRVLDDKPKALDASRLASRLADALATDDPRRGTLDTAINALMQ